MSGQTPRVEHCLSLDNGGNGLLSFKRMIELARELEREGHQTRIDAAHDSKRLIDDKMKLREQLAEAVAALREFVTATSSGPNGMTNMRDVHARADFYIRIDAIRERARAIVARLGG